MWDPCIGVAYHPISLIITHGFGSHVGLGLVVGVLVSLLVLRGVVALISLAFKSMKQREYVELE